MNYTAIMNVFQRSKNLAREGTDGLVFEFAVPSQAARNITARDVLQKSRTRSSERNVEHNKNEVFIHVKVIGRFFLPNVLHNILVANSL